MSGVQLFDARRCQLGEGPLWHPLRQELFWFDILNAKMYSRVQGEAVEWPMPEMCSAAGWIDRHSLLVAGESALYRFVIRNAQMQKLVDLEKDKPGNRSNDGRADPWGGFWIGTMGKQAEHGQGAIYRYCGGELRQLLDGVSISNAICFDQSRSYAYYVDTAEGIVWRQPVDHQGWPQGERQVYIDTRAEDFCVDGALIDAEGFFISARWGAGQVARYAPSGELLATVDLPTPLTTCPAYIGEKFTDLIVTTAYGESADEGEDTSAGATYIVPGWGVGLPEPCVHVA